MSNPSDFVIKENKLTKYVGPGGDVVIPEGVTEIGGGYNTGAFYRCSDVVSVKIPNSVTSIGDWAFEDCSSLTSVTIPDGVTSIGWGAFDGCSCLTNVTIPEGVTSIDNSAFDGCSCLTNVTIPEGVTSIGWGAFRGCSSLTSVIIPDSVTSIGWEAFEDCSSLTNVTIPDGVTSIGTRAFRGCRSLADADGFVIVKGILFDYIGSGGDVNIPEGVTSIGERAFKGCSKLRQVKIPDSMQSIGVKTFDKDISLLLLDISLLPANLRPNAIVGFAENGGNSGTAGFDSHSKYIKSHAAKLVDTAMNHPALLSLMCREKLIPPKNVELYVEASQKTGNAELIAMTLDYQANKISASQKQNVEKQKNEEQETVVERMVARQDKKGIAGLNIALTGRLETFMHREDLKAFIEKSGGTLASTVTAKVDYLIMNDPTADSEKAERAKELGIQIITERCFNELAGRAFVMRGKTLVRYAGNGGDVVVPEGVTTIRDYAFYKCETLTSVTLPDSLTSIKKKAFQGCRLLTEITIPSGVNRIDKEAFAACRKLTIHAPAGSYAEQYAKENRIRFAAE